MPMAEEYEDQLKSNFADCANTAGREGGAITAACFLGKFTEGLRWAHLDIAGVALNSPASETNAGWASGFGVALLDRFVRDNYEK